MSLMGHRRIPIKCWILLVSLTVSVSDFKIVFIHFFLRSIYICHQFSRSLTMQLGSSEVNEYASVSDNAVRYGCLGTTTF